MNLYDQIKRIERIDHLIKSISAECPVQLARRLHISPGQTILGLCRTYRRNTGFSPQNNIRRE
jgi:hypothetical protein